MIDNAPKGNGFAVGKDQLHVWQCHQERDSVVTTKKVSLWLLAAQSLGQRSKIKGSIQIQEVHVGLHSNA